MMWLKILAMALEDAGRAERLLADRRFRSSLRRYPAASLATFALAHAEGAPRAELRRIERMVVTRQIA